MATWRVAGHRKRRLLADEPDLARAEAKTLRDRRLHTAAGIS